ncbi:MAG TPA: 50S ribosomal protein L23 [Candidatus Saccharimonadales bacterium]|nr:50S ribosomal protein L23 [Candidatus Saccharimonadales bacterium]
MHLTLVPRMSEKAYATAQNDIYVFSVPTTANKQQIAAAISAQFNVHVTTVNTVVQKGKAVRSVRKGKSIPGRHAKSKKAYVRLQAGERLGMFDEEEKK